MSALEPQPMRGHRAWRYAPHRDCPGDVGPSLDGIPLRVIIAGHLADDPANMEKWTRDPAACLARHRHARPSRRPRRLTGTLPPFATRAQNDQRSGGVRKLLPIRGRDAHQLGAATFAPAPPPTVYDMRKSRGTAMTNKATQKLRDHRLGSRVSRMRRQQANRRIWDPCNHIHYLIFG